LISILSLSALSTSQAINQEIITEKPILGDSDIYKQTINDTSKYLLKTNNITLSETDFEKNNNTNSDYAIKPDITTTEDTEEKIKKEQAEKYAQSRRNVVTRDRNTRTTTTTATETNYTSVRTSNSYAYGYCTWYVANKRTDLPNQLGNGGSWYSNAQKNGLATGKEAQVGAVIVTNESWAGHVGYVESVSDTSITISEMNFNGWNRVNTRTLSKDEAIIKGYIY